MIPLLALLMGIFTAAAPATGALRVEVHARSMQPGEIVMFEVTAPERTQSVRLRAFGRDVPAYSVDGTTWRALIGIDLDVRPGTHIVSIEAHGDAAAPAAQSTYQLRVSARTFPTRRLRVDDAFVNPPASQTARIAREAALLAQLWTHSADERLWSGPFVKPVPGAANSAFGTRSIFNGKPLSPHSGGDFLSPAGTPIKAPGGGRVVLADNLYFSGNTVVIDHGLGLFSLLAHMSEIDVHAGDRVKADDVVGKVGATGRVTGPHLHWAVRAGGARVDPLALLALLGSGS